MSDKNTTKSAKTDKGNVKFSLFSSVLQSKTNKNYTAGILNMGAAVNAIRKNLTIKFDPDWYFLTTIYRLERDKHAPLSRGQFNDLFAGCITNGLLSVKAVNDRIKEYSKSYVENEQNDTQLFKAQYLATLKMSLPCFVFGGETTQRNNKAIEDNFTGLIQIDWDIKEKGGDKLTLAKKAELAKDPYLIFLAVGPSGYGLKGAIRTKQPYKQFAAVKKALFDYFLSTYGIEIDMSISAGGACFLPYENSMGRARKAKKKRAPQDAKKKRLSGSH